MAKLFFKYGTVFSAKSLNLLATAHNYETQGKKVCLMMPSIDTRADGKIKTRAGHEKEAILIKEEDDIFQIYSKYVKEHGRIDCVLVDEVQMLQVHHIDELREIVEVFNTPVICYGLRVSYTLELFDASARLLALADKLEEIKTICWFCNSKATHNIRMVDGEPVYEGNMIEIGGLEKFLPVCYSCYKNPKRK